MACRALEGGTLDHFLPVVIYLCSLQKAGFFWGGEGSWGFFCVSVFVLGRLRKEMVGRNSLPSFWDNEDGQVYPGTFWNVTAKGRHIDR